MLPEVGVKVEVALQQLSFWAYQRRLCVAAAACNSLMHQVKGVATGLRMEPDLAAAQQPHQKVCTYATTSESNFQLKFLFARLEI